MKKTKLILSGIAFAFAAICLSSSTASAATACSALMLPANVTTTVLATSTGCDAGGLNFSNFSVSANPATMNVLLANVDVTSSSVNLGFQIGGFAFSLPTSAPDLRLSYEVKGTTTGVDNLFGGSPGTSLLEIVCDSKGIASGTSCVDTPLGFILNSGLQHGSLTFATPQTNIWIIKDITVQSNFTGTAVEVSDFTNSHATSTIPEPMTLSMMGAGLLGLSLMSRRRKKS